MLPLPAIDDRHARRGRVGREGAVRDAHGQRQRLAGSVIVSEGEARKIDRAGGGRDKQRLPGVGDDGELAEVEGQRSAAESGEVAVIADRVGQNVLAVIGAGKARRQQLRLALDSAGFRIDRDNIGLRPAIGAGQVAGVTGEGDGAAVHLIHGGRRRRSPTIRWSW